MNRVIGFTFFLLLLAGLAFITLKGMRPIAESSADTTYTGMDWRAISIAGESLAPNVTLLLRFEIDGKISGHGGCNSFFSSYTSSESGIVIGPIGATRMACPEPLMSIETQFFDALQNTTLLEVRGRHMKLLNVSGEVLVELLMATADNTKSP